MGLNTLVIERYIKADRHLRLEGNESREELMDACYFLWEHDWRDCQLKRKGTPMAALVPDRNQLIYRKPGRKKVQDVTNSL